MALELTIPAGGGTFADQMEKLLSKKAKLVAQDAGDGRNKYQVEVNKLKKKIKEYNKSQAKKDGVPKVKFGSLLSCLSLSL